MLQRRWLVVWFLAVLATARAETVRFELTHATAWGESVYVLGSLPALGAGDVTRAPRLVPGAGQRWSLALDLPPGQPYAFAYVLRKNAPEALGDPQNAERLGPVQRARVPGVAPEREVAVEYFSGWARAFVRYARDAEEDARVELTRAGPGRGPGEHRYTGTARTTLPELVFELEDGQGGRDRAPGGARYRSPRPRVSLTDGVVAGGVPGRGRVVHQAGFASQLLGNRRDVFVYLPPGYEAGSQRYPVLYMHDGQNLFGAQALFGGWGVGEAADRLIARGEVEPLLIVGVGNTAQRMSEYIPPQDEGRADRYARFLLEELKPWVDQTYRTRPDAASTGVCGSSLGGIVSLYLGWTHPDVFSRVGSLSGSYWLDAFTDEALQGAPPALTIYLDSGSAGTSADGIEGTFRVRDQLLGLGLVLGRDLHHRVDLGGLHNERSWRGRFPDVLRTLFPPRVSSGVAGHLGGQ
ncbi:MAG: alpha/beta hydrolase-fold protein [Planctomycetota bacterium]